MAAADAPATDVQDPYGQDGPPTSQPSDTAPAGGGPPTAAPVEESPPPLKAKREAAKSGSKSARPAYWDTDMSGAVGAAQPQGDINAPAERPGYWDTDMSANDQPPPAQPPPNGMKPHEWSFLKGALSQSNNAAVALNLAAATGPMLLDKIHSWVTGIPQTGMQDDWFKNAVEPVQQGGAAFEERPDADFVDKAMHGLGRTAMMIDQAIASGGEAGAGVAAGGGAVARAAGGAVTMQAPAAAAAIETGNQVMQATGDAKAARTAGVVSYLVNSASGAVPMGVGGNLAARVGSAAVAGAGMQEVGRVAQNAAMPADMQQPFDAKEDALAALTTAPFGFMPHGMPEARGVVERAPSDAMERAQAHAAEAVAAEGGDGMSQVVAMTQVNAHVGAVHDAAAVHGAREAEAAHQDAALQAHQQAELEQQQAEAAAQAPPPAEPEPGAGPSGLPAEQHEALQTLKAKRTAAGADEPEQTVQERMKANAKGTEDEFEELPAEEAAKAPEAAPEPAEEEEAPETNPAPVKPADLAARRQAALDEAMAAKVRGQPPETTPEAAPAPAEEGTPAPATPEEPIAAPAPPNRLAAIRVAAEKRQQGRPMPSAAQELIDEIRAGVKKPEAPEEGALSSKREENGWFNDQDVARDLDRAMNPRMEHDEAKEHLSGVSDATAPRSFMIHASQDADTVPKHLADQITAVKANGLRVKGAYEDGVAHIFADSHKAGDKEDLLNTAVHELTHQGLHSFLGKDYSDTLTGIAHDIKDTKWAKDYVTQRGYDLKNPTHMRLLGDEYAAHLAENQFAGKDVHGDLPVPDRDPSHWQRITDAVRGGLRKLGLVKHWNDNDIARLIRQAQAHVSGAEPLKAARDGAEYKASGGARFSLDNDDKNMEDHYAPDHPLAVGHKFGRTMEEQANYNPGFIRSVKGALSDFRDNAPRKVLGAIGLRNLPDFMSADKMPNLHGFIDAHDAMEGRKGQMHTRDTALAKEWSQWNAKQDDRGHTLSDLMTASTMAGHDPSKPYEERYTAADRAANPEAARDEKYQRAMHKSLQDDYNNKLDDKGKELYNRVRDNYAQKRSQVYDALKARIEQTDADGETKKNLMAELRKSFESNTVKGPYFPLQRFGDLWANAKDENGNTKAFSRFESGAQQKAWMAEMRKQGLDVDGGKRMDTNSMMERIDPDFVRNVMGLAHDADPSGDLEKEIWQQYLRAMPEMSMRKHMISRVGRLGYSQDSLRAFAYNSFHGAHQLARLEYGHQLESKLSGAEQDARALEQKAAQNPDDKNAQTDGRWAPELARELKDRYEWIKNPRASQLASNLTKFGFTWYLGAAPATAFRIFSQNPMLAAPMLAKHFNWLGASKELSRATGQWAKSYGSLGDTLRGDERRAHDEASDMGVFSNNNTQMLASGGQGGPIGHGPYAAFAKAAGFLFNAMENHNRMTTHLAAYRLGRQADMGHADAAKLARQITWDSHFDYTNANRPRYLQNDTAKVIGLFKQYSLGVTYRLAREFRDMTASETDPQARKDAAVAFGGLIGRMSMFAGVTGMPLYWIAEKVMNTVMGSQDQPYDMTAALHKHLNDALGETAGDAIMTGPVGAISGASLSGGASYNDLWYRPPSREESTSAQMLDGLGQLLGPIAAIPTNAAAGIDMMRTGNTERGLEHMLPPEAAALAKSVRYATQGANNMSGEPVVPKDQITNRDLFLQSVGFTPQKMADAYARNSAIKNIDKDITDRHNLLTNQFETAMLNGDQKEMDRLQPSIDAFNKANPGMAIGKNLAHGAMSKARNAATAQAGVNVAKGNEHLEQEY